MERQGAEADWVQFHAALGRYFTAAGNAESLMFRLLLAMCSTSARAAPQKAPAWSGLVKALLKEAQGGPFEARANELLKGAQRRGRVRNNIVHTGWFSAAPDCYVGRRHFQNGDGSAMFIMRRDTLEETLATMEWFENELERLAQDVAQAR